MTNPTTPQGEPISLPPLPTISPMFTEAQLQAHATAAVIADRAHRAASPDVAKMVDEAKRLAHDYAADSYHDRPSKYKAASLCTEAIDALGAAATQARAAVGAEQSDMRAALQDALEFIEYYSRHWNGVSAKHPNTIAMNARAALSAQTPGEGWMPIESAPKDGTHILATQEGARYQLVGIGFNQIPPHVVHWFVDGFYLSTNYGEEQTNPLRYSYWRPLGDTPKGN